MALDLVAIRVKRSVLEDIKNICKELYKKDHPDMKNMNLSIQFLIEEIVEYYKQPTIKGILR